jgi:hypothetical protein
MELPVEKIVLAYIKIRDTKEKLYQEYKSQENNLQAQMDTLKEKLIEMSKETGVTSFSTPAGIAYRTIKKQILD